MNDMKYGMKYGVSIIGSILRPFYGVMAKKDSQPNPEMGSSATKQLLSSSTTTATKKAAPSDTQLKIRNSYQRLLWMVVGIVLIHLLVLLVVEFIRPDWNHVDYALRLQRLHKLISENPEKPIGIALGSSRTSMGLDTTTLSRLSNTNLFTLAFPGSGPVQELMYLQRLIADGVRPNYVIIEILPGMLFNPISDLQPIIENENRANLSWDGIGMRDLSLLERYHDPDVNVLFHFFLTRPEIIRGHGNDWLMLFESKWSFVETGSKHNRFGFDDHGWLPYTTSTFSEERKMRGVQQAKENYYGTLQKGEMGTRSPLAYEELLSWLQDHHLPYYLYLMPEGNTFRSWYNPSCEAQLQNWLKRIHDKYSAVIIDTRTWMPDEAFFDSHHLLPNFGTVFAQRFGQEILIPFLQHRGLLSHADTKSR